MESITVDKIDFFLSHIPHVMCYIMTNSSKKIIPPVLIEKWDLTTTTASIWYLISICPNLNCYQYNTNIDSCIWLRREMGYNANQWLKFVNQEDPFIASICTNGSHDFSRAFLIMPEQKHKLELNRLTKVTIYCFLFLNLARTKDA